jgi:tRNA(fMet)-specific endonuclease VapC
MVAYVLDTDTCSLWRDRHPAVSRRVVRVVPDRMGVTVITVDEVLSGWQAAVRRPLPPPALAAKYAQLAEAVVAFRRFQIETLSIAAIAEFERLRRGRLNVGANDLRIAAIALTLNATVVTRNRRDFGRVPGLSCEGWSVPDPAA